MNRAHSAGFGLLEAIVALVLISATGLALFSWVNTNLAEASRLHERDASARLQMAAVEFLGSVNPSLEPRGQRTVGQLNLSWETTAQGAEAPGMSFLGLPTNYRLQLYDAAVEVRDERSAAATQFHVTLVGYRKSNVPAT